MTRSTIDAHAMSEIHPDLRYLLPREDSFWRWSADGKAIEWIDGRTIAFRPELASILARLAPTGFPPLGALLLLLAATRESWAEATASADSILAGYQQLDSPGALMAAVISKRVRFDVVQLADDLSAVANLPADLKQKPAARASLAEFVFSVVKPAIDATSASRVIRLLETGIDPDSLRHVARPDSDFSHLIEELDALRPGLARVSAEPFSTWLRTGLDREIHPAPGVDVPEGHRVRGLIQNLRDDPQLSGIARLARDLLAAVHVPRNLAAPEDLAVGGVSDISNRGPLDRLLVSELAHDDLTLAVRVALNEALYLRRESPAQHPPLSRAILIDVGIRLWGVPRLFAAAVALALAASAEDGAPIGVVRNCRSAVLPIDLTTRDGVLSLLESLEPDPHPAACLDPWLTALEESPLAEGAATEAFVITHQSAFVDPEFAAALQALASGDRECHVATVTDDGSFALWLIGPAGRRELCRAQLSLDEIATPPSTDQSSAALLARNPNLPAILFMHPFPLLLAASINPKRSIHDPELGLFAVTNDRRLMHWTSDITGGAQLVSDLPRGRIECLFCDCVARRVFVVIVDAQSTLVHIVAVDLTDGLVERREYEQKQPQRVFFHHGAIHLAHKSIVRVIQPTMRGTWSEQAIDLKTMSPHWCGVGRFFQFAGRFYAFSTRGAIEINRGPSAKYDAQPFDRAGVGPWLLRRDGMIQPADDDGAILAIDRPSKNGIFRLLATSHDGNRLLAEVQIDRGWHPYHIDLAAAKPSWQNIRTDSVRAEDYAWLLGRALYWPTGIMFRNSFDAAVVHEGRTLALLHDNQQFVIDTTGIDSQSTQLVLRSTKISTKSSDRTTPVPAGFARGEHPPGTHYTLRAARWRDGSQVFLDTRGMLHLMSSNKRLPQFSLALCDGPMAGWTSDGRTFGRAYFLPHKPSDDAALGATLLHEFVRRLR